MKGAMKTNGSPPPEFDSDEDRTYFLIRLPVHERAERGAREVTPHVERLLAAIDGEHHRDELLDRLGLSDRKHFRTQFLAPAMAAGLVEMTDPGSPRSTEQRYRLTDLGRDCQAELASRGPNDAEKTPE